MQEAVRFEKQTRLQSRNPLWYKIRKKDPSRSIKRMKSTRHVTTAAMQQGLASAQSPLLLHFILHSKATVSIPILVAWL